jgi:hypothetical protein
MTELEVRTEMSYNDEYIEFVRISQNDISRPLSEKTYENEILEVSESGNFEHDFGDVYLQEGCKFDLEVITPQPCISVEVSTEHISENSSEYAAWLFEGPSATTAFEKWVDKNNLKVTQD